jgi:predicted O-methyltransferase YrrM
MNKLEYILNRIKNINNIQILELGVRNGNSTKLFIEICDRNLGNLMSVDINDCSKVISNKRWKFIKSSDDNFELINSNINQDLDVIFIDSLHEPDHVKKVFYNYYNKLKINGLCFIDDISWLPYAKDSYRDSDYVERINRLTFDKILEIKFANKDNFILEFLFVESGLAIIKKKKINLLEEPKKIYNRIFSFKNLLKKIYSPRPKS